MNNLKHTQNYAEKLAKIIYTTEPSSISEFAIDLANPKRDAYVKGYMKAIEETAVKDMLEALIKSKTVIQSLCLLLKTNPESFKEYNQMVNAINKATK